MSSNKLIGAKILMIIAPSNFRDEEYFIPWDIFVAEGAEVLTASTQRGSARGSQGGEAVIDYTLDNISGGDFSAFIFIGGQGAYGLINDSNCHRIAKEALEAGRMICAICIAPVILAKAGILQGKRATVWTSETDKSAVALLEQAGAIYQNDDIVQDGLIITANGPTAARKFAETIVNLLGT